MNLLASKQKVGLGENMLGIIPLDATQRESWIKWNKSGVSEQVTLPPLKI